MYKLTGENVERIFVDCLYRSEEWDPETKATPPGAVIVQGIMVDFGFHPGRIAQHRAELLEMIKELPEPFFSGSDGGGWSFLAMCNDRDGRQWADLHLTMEKLMCLAMAAKLASYCAPREIWGALPGGMPYVVFSKE